MEDAAGLGPLPPRGPPDCAAGVADGAGARCPDGEAGSEEDSAGHPGRGPGAEAAPRRTDGRSRLRTWQLRRELGRLDELRAEKGLSVQSARAELQASRRRTGRLREQRDRLAAAEAEATSTAAAGRLRAAARRLSAELDGELGLQAALQAAMQESQSALWHAELRAQRLEPARAAAAEEGAADQRRLRDRAAERLRQQREALGRAERSRRLGVRKSLAQQKEHGLRHQRLVEDAQRNHRAAVRFLKASLARVQAQKQQEELASQELARRRMDAVLALKTSISANRETLRKFQAWGQSRAAQEAQRAQAEREAVLAQGGDAFRRLVHQRRHRELEAQQRTLAEQQQRRKQDIVSRILREQLDLEARESRRRPPTPARPLATLRDRTWQYLAEWEGGAAEAPDGPRDELPLPRSAGLGGVVSSESVHGSLEQLTAGEETLAEPEIPGLWSEGRTPRQVPSEDLERKPVGGTRMEQAILARTLRRLRDGLLRPQVASGREFRGRPFYCKPRSLSFKDFDVGKVYRKKVTLVNASYTISHCKLLGVEDHLRDFIHVHFDPPGPLSAGMSCEALVTFKPMVNQDLEGSVSFLAQTGRFSVPLACSTKKCSLSLDKEHVEFGSYVVGETAARTVTLANAGGLGTRFRFLRASEAGDTNTFVSILEISDLLAHEDKPSSDKVAASPSELRLGDPRPPALDSTGPEAPWGPGSRELGGPPPPEAEPGPGPAAAAGPCGDGDEQPEITLGEGAEGEVGPFCSVKVPVIFSPAVPGRAHARFKVVFQNPQCPTLYFSAAGTALDVPVWVPRPCVDLGICMYDRLYQDAVVIHSRSKVAQRLQLEVSRGLRGHVELLPQTGYVQASSTCSVQLKFLPRHSLPQDAGRYFDKDTWVLEAPMTIRVADQVKPVRFSVHAVVTTSDLELRPAAVDFGPCTVFEAVRTRVRLRNCSLLPQDFGFVGLPKFVDVQPNDGFGTVLPLETLELDVTFQPTRAKAYSFELRCKSDIDRCFRLPCRGVGVQPPLELSQQQVRFPATSLYDTSLATLYVVHAESPRPLPRAGSAAPAPAGPTSFEFLLPARSPVSISPAVGTVQPGKRCLVQVAFRPVLPEEPVCREALRARAAEAREDTAAPGGELQRQDGDPAPASPPPAPELGPPRCRCSPDEHQAALAALTRAFQGRFERLVVPCVVAGGDVRDGKGGAGPLRFSPQHTLYLELWCPSVAPAIVALSNGGRTVSDFGDVAVGHRGVKKIAVQNTTPEGLDVEFSVLNPNGPFVLLNPISRLSAGETHVLAVSFSPRESLRAQETLDIICKRGKLALTLRGTGVASVVTCSLEGDVLDMGYVMARESVSSSFKLQNDSALPVKFSVQLDSLAPRGEAQQQLPRFLTAPGPAQRTEVVGTQNLGGQSVFSVVPAEGVMEPGRAQDFTVTFSPDHESLYFSDRLRVVLFGKKVSHEILLRGAGRERAVFVEGGDPLDVPVESLALLPAPDVGRGEEAEEPRTVLLTLEYVPGGAEESAPPATRELRVGCIRTAQPATKKSVDFSVDNVAALQLRGFAVEPARGSVERGQTRPISFSWAPPADFDPDRPLTASAMLQLRGDVKETCRILLVAHVAAGP